VFIGNEKLEGRDFKIEFHWIPLDRIQEIKMFLSNASRLLQKRDEGVKHFISKEE